MAESDSNQSSVASDEEEPVVMYRCRKCPNAPDFTAAEVDLHRAQHKKKRRKSRPRTGREVDSSVATSTIFEPVVPVAHTSRVVQSTPPVENEGAQGAAGNNEAENNEAGNNEAGNNGAGNNETENGGTENRRRKLAKKSTAGPSKKPRKIRSYKKYDRHVESVTIDGG